MLFGLSSFMGQSSFQHPSTLSWKAALNVSLKLLTTCNELLWKCVRNPPTHTHHHHHHTLSLSVVIGSYGCRVVQCDDGNAAANAHPLPVGASMSHKAAVQPGGGIKCVCVDRFCSAETLRGSHTERGALFIWAFTFLRAGDEENALKLWSEAGNYSRIQV